jgi:PBSX family phage terminase large subunit
MIYRAHPKQIEFHKSLARIRGAFAGKRGGKTEAGAVEAIIRLSQKPDDYDDSIDPWLLVIIAPTTDMLRRLSMSKFLAYAKPFISIDRDYNKSVMEGQWPNGAKFIGISGDKPSRLEGVKASCGIWIDEVFQIDEQLYIESLARISDSGGKLWVTGSLGTQYVNPKSHWAYKHFKETPQENSALFEWTTAENPYFPRDELDRLRNTLDPRTYKAMFEIDWNIPATNRVFDTFDEFNIGTNTYNKDLPVYVSMDFGWNDPTAVLFIQHDPRTDKVYVIDEIVRTKTLLSDIVKLMRQKPYPIAAYYCDSAGNQTREQTARSNVRIMREDFGINFKWRSTPIVTGITLMRTYIKNAKGEQKLIIDQNCKHLLEELTNYKYIERNQTVTDTPEDKNNHSVDALRYWFVNYIKDKNMGATMKELDRWDILSW